MKIDFSKYKILTIGDIILDSYTFGQVNRVSPEAPVPILDVENIEFKLGGAANVASNIAKNSAQSILLGFRSDDINGQKINELCEKQGIIYCGASNSKSTIVKNRIIAKGQQMVRIDHEPKKPFDSLEIKNLKEIFDKTISNEKIDGLVLQDYNKGSLTESLIKHIIQVAKRKNIPVVVDPKFKNLKAYQYCTIFKPNKVEFDRAIEQFEINSNLSFKEKSALLQEKLKFEKIYITLGADGIYSFELDQTFPTISSDLVDITGAGDSLVSSLILMHLEGIKEEMLCTNLNLIGSKVIQKIGTVSIDFSDFISS